MAKHERHESVVRRKADKYPPCPSSSSSVTSVSTSGDEEPQKQAHEEDEGEGACDGSFSGQHEHEHVPLPSGMPRMLAIASRIQPSQEVKIGSRVLGIWRALAKRRAEEKRALTDKAREAQMEFFEATRNITRAGRHTFRDPVQSSAFILEVAFTWWKNAIRSLQQNKRRREEVLRRGNKQNRTEPGAILLQQHFIGVPRGARHKRPGALQREKAHSAGCTDSSTYARRHQQHTPGLNPWTAQHSRSMWLDSHDRSRGRGRGVAVAAVRSAPCSRPRRCGGIENPDETPIPRTLASSAPSACCSGGRGVLLRSRKSPRPDLSSDDEDGDDNCPGERDNVLVAPNRFSDRRCQEAHERGDRPRKPTESGDTPPLKRESELTSAVAAPVQSPFVVGGPLCAKYPSCWTAAGSTGVDANLKPLVAWVLASTAERQERSAPQPIPGLEESSELCDSAPNGVQPPSGTRPTVTGFWCARGFSRRMHCRDGRVVSLMKAAATTQVSRSAFGDVLEALPAYRRASMGRSRCTSHNSTFSASVYSEHVRGVDGENPSPRHQEVMTSGGAGGARPRGARSTRSMCFGRYRLLVD